MAGDGTVSAPAADRAARAELRAALDELHEAQAQAGERPGIGRLRWMVIAAAVIVSLVLAALSVTAWVRTERAYSDADYESAAARRVAVLLTPDHRDPARARKILAGATGAFHDEFAQSADSYTTFVREHGTVADATVDATALSGRAGDTATVLVATTVVFEGAGATPGEARRFRLRVLITPADGELKLSAVQYLP